jgi:hypothetical protein
LLHASFAFFFLSVFWGYILLSTCYNIRTDGYWSPAGIEESNLFEIPLLVTILLLSSLATVIYAHPAVFESSRNGMIACAAMTLLFAIVFIHSSQREKCSQLRREFMANILLEYMFPPVLVWAGSSTCVVMIFVGITRIDDDPGSLRGCGCGCGGGGGSHGHGEPNGVSNDASDVTFDQPLCGMEWSGRIAYRTRTPRPPDPNPPDHQTHLD